MKNNYFLALTSAILLWLAWPPIPYTAVLLLIAFFPLLLAIENIVGSNYKKKGKYIFRICFLTFLTWNTASIYWVFNSLNAVMPAWTAVLISFIPFGLAAILMTLAFLLYYRLQQINARVWSYAGLVCFWIAYEYLHQTWDLAFPWMNLGNGFAQSHFLVQWYEYTGVYGGTYWVLVSNILAFETYLAFKASGKSYEAEKTSQNLSDDKRKWILLIRTASHILIPIAISLFMYTRYKESINPANVVVV